MSATTRGRSRDRRTALRELIACDVADVGSHSWHHTLARRTTKGDQPTVIALASPTMQVIAAASTLGGKAVLLNRTGRRMTAYNVQYLVAVLARDARMRPVGHHPRVGVGVSSGTLHLAQGDPCICGMVM